HDDSIFIDVIRALHRIQNRIEILDLRLTPPRRVGPGVRDDVNLLSTGQSANGPIAPRLITRSHHTTVKLKADLITMGRVVRFRDIQCVEELAAMSTVARLDDPFCDVRRVRPPRLEALRRLLESDTAIDDV